MSEPIATAVSIFGAAFGVYVVLIVLTRLVGLRSFSKLSSFDFAVTVAFGSIIAAVVVSPDPPLFAAVVGLASLYLIQTGVSIARRHVDFVARVVDNEPLLLMAGRQVIDENLARANISRSDIKAKLREANVIDYGEIFAVVMESTGDVSVLHGDPAEKELEEGLLEGVRGAERFTDTGNTASRS